MIGHGDRHQDIAAWFGVNQGRIAEVRQGEIGTGAVAPVDQLLAKGPPGIKGKRLRETIGNALEKMTSGTLDVEGMKEAIRDALAKFDSHEA